jgi:hypothetical protein
VEGAVFFVVLVATGAFFVVLVATGAFFVEVFAITLVRAMIVGADQIDTCDQKNLGKINFPMARPEGFRRKTEIFRLLVFRSSDILSEHVGRFRKQGPRRK